MNKEKLVPRLRFKSFFKKLDWQYTKLGEVADIVGGGTPSTQIGKYWNGDINWFSPTEIGETSYLNSSERKITKLGLKKSSAKILPIGTVLFTSRAGIGKTAILEKESTTNQGFQSIVPKKNILNSYFIYSRSEEIKNYAEIVGAGSTFVEVSGKQLEKMMLLIPELKEQQKIGSFFEKIDKMIQLQQSKVNKVKDIKSAYLSEMFPKEGEKYPKKRIGGFTEPWTAKKLGSLLDYEQPTNYLVKSDSYDDSYLTPVLTAGKSFLLGYTNETEGIYKADNNNGVIIFDDFTTSSHFVDFDFKVKSSAMKFLRTNQSNFNLYFLYNLLTSINYSPESHERHWISIFSEFEVLVPTKKEQEKIAQLFKNLDNQISIEEEKLTKLEKLKQAYLNDMFV